MSGGSSTQTSIGRPIVIRPEVIIGDREFSEWMRDTETTGIRPIKLDMLRSGKFLPDTDTWANTLLRSSSSGSAWNFLMNLDAQDEVEMDLENLAGNLSYQSKQAIQGEINRRLGRLMNLDAEDEVEMDLENLAGNLSYQSKQAIQGEINRRLGRILI